MNVTEAAGEGLNRLACTANTTQHKAFHLAKTYSPVLLWKALMHILHGSFPGRFQALTPGAPGSKKVQYHCSECHFCHTRSVMNRTHGTTILLHIIAPRWCTANVLHDVYRIQDTFG
jgi:hypothetical protein